MIIRAFIGWLIGLIVGCTIGVSIVTYFSLSAFQGGIVGAICGFIFCGLGVVISIERSIKNGDRDKN